MNFVGGGRGRAGRCEFWVAIYGHVIARFGGVMGWVCLEIENIILGGGRDGRVRTVLFSQDFSKDKVLEMGGKSVCGNEI